MFFEAEIQEVPGNDLLVKLHILNKTHYKYEFDPTEYLGDYYAPHSGEEYRFYLQGEDLYVKSTSSDSPNFSSDKLEPAGYRTYRREWFSAMGHSSVSFSFNAGMGGFDKANVMGNLIDYPSQGFFLYRRR